MHWILIAMVVALVLGRWGQWPVSLTIAAGMLFGTLWYMMHLLERIAVRLGAAHAPQPDRSPDPDDLLRRRTGRVAPRQKYQVQGRPRV